MRRLRRLMRHTIWAVLKQALLAAYGLSIRVRIFGKDRVALPLRHSFIVAANHVTGADSIVIQVALRTRLFFIAWSRWFNTSFVGFFMRHLCDTVPVRTGGGAENVPGLRACVEALREGACIGIYPEGELNRTGLVDHLHDGCAWLAARTQTPILPVYVHNLKLGPEPFSQPWINEAWEGFFSVVGNVLNTRIEVLLGDPIQPDPAALRGPDDLRHEVERLNSELRRQFDKLILAASNN